MNISHAIFKRYWVKDRKSSNISGSTEKRPPPETRESHCIDLNGLCHQYINDTQRCPFFPSKAEEAIWALDLCQVSVMDWMRMNKLELNPDKSEGLLVSQKANEGIGI